jgi:hypothetical protein
MYNPTAAAEGNFCGNGNALKDYSGRLQETHALCGHRRQECQIEKVKQSHNTEWTGRIAPTHSRPQHCMGVSGQHHIPATLLSLGKGPPSTHWTGSWVGPTARLDTEARRKILFCLCSGSNEVVQSVVRHYTD